MFDGHQDRRGPVQSIESSAAGIAFRPRHERRLRGICGLRPSPFEFRRDQETRVQRQRQHDRHEGGARRRRRTAVGRRTS